MAGAAFNRGESRQDWETPVDFLTAVRNKFGIEQFYWDLAASPHNAKAVRFFTEIEDSLKQRWPHTPNDCYAWLNPPYDNIKPWVQKAAENPQTQSLVLVPASVGANWYRDWVFPYAQTYILNGRLTFVGATTPYPKDLMLLHYGGIKTCNITLWTWKNEL